MIRFSKLQTPDFNLQTSHGEAWLPQKPKNTWTIYRWRISKKVKGNGFLHGCWQTHLLNVRSKPQPAPHSNRSCNRRIGFLGKGNLVKTFGHIWHDFRIILRNIYPVRSFYSNIIGIKHVNLDKPETPTIDSRRSTPRCGTKEWSSRHMRATNSLMEPHVALAEQEFIGTGFGEERSWKMKV